MQEKRGGLSATLYPVAVLTDNEVYHKVNHILHLDNWFDSIELCQLCMTRQILVNGTVKANRKGLPKEGLFPKKGKGKMAKGSVKCMQMMGSDIYLTAWMDNKPVHMLSTIRPKLQEIMRKSAAEGWKRVAISSHSLIPAYNFGMGGTDRMDQMNSYYGFHHKGIKWTHRIFTHFLGVCVVNAYILYGESKAHKKLSKIEFFDEVIKSLADLARDHNWDAVTEKIPEIEEMEPTLPAVYFSSEDELEPPVSVGPAIKPKGKVFHRYRKGKSNVRVERLEGIHYPTLLSCNNRRRCVFHPEIKQRYFCPTCDVALCLSDVPEKGCWYKYHHEEDWRDI